MEEVGELLRKAREDQQLSISEIAEKTNIKSEYLHAIETGDESVFPAEVYLRGFLRSYAKSLGVSPDQIIDRYDQNSMDIPSSSQPKLSRVEKRRAARRKKRIWFGVGLGVILASLVFYYILNL